MTGQSRMKPVKCARVEYRCATLPATHARARARLSEGAKGAPRRRLSPGKCFLRTRGPRAPAFT